nr:unnamed protein product [Digitaria exilis]
MGRATGGAILCGKHWSRRRGSERNADPSVRVKIGGARVGQRGADLTRPSPGDAICWTAVANTSPRENGLAPGHSILTVGDGDFSFSLALARAFGSGANLVATSLDSYVALLIKYREAESNTMELKRFGATVLHGINVKTMKLHTELKNRRFDRIVFNFPHAGFKGRGHTELYVIKSHKELVAGFFSNAHHLLERYGEIHVSNKTGHPYDSWDLENLASKSSLVLFKKVVFHKGDYPGYNQKRGDGPKCNKSFKLGPCCMFKFQISEAGRSGNSGA